MYTFKRKEYDIIKAYCAEELVTMVRKEMDKGTFILGAPIFLHGAMHQWYQPIIRYIECEAEFPE